MANENDDIFEETLTQQLNTFRIDATVRRKVLRDLRRLENKIIAEIAEIAPADSERFQARRLRSLLQRVRALINADYETINQELEEELTGLARIESDRQGKILSDTLEVAVTTTSLPESRVNSIYRNTLIEGAPSRQWWARQSRQLNQRFEDQMREGLLLGETNEQLIRRVRGTRTFNFTNGIMNITRRNAETLVRSSVQAVANQARFEMLQANRDVLRSYRHVSTLDSRTSDQCIVRDNKRWDAQTLEPIGHSLPFRVPPIHFNCRSTLVGEVRGTNLVDDAERASIDGPVPARTDFREFLERKGKAFQDEVLGPGKAELWRDGKITLQQLLDQQGNPLTLAELRQRYDN